MDVSHGWKNPFRQRLVSVAAWSGGAILCLEGLTFLINKGSLGVLRVDSLKYPEDFLVFLEARALGILRRGVS